MSVIQQRAELVMGRRLSVLQDSPQGREGVGGLWGWYILQTAALKCLVRVSMMINVVMFLFEPVMMVVVMVSVWVCVRWVWWRSWAWDGSIWPQWVPQSWRRRPRRIWRRPRRIQDGLTVTCSINTVKLNTSGRGEVCVKKIKKLQDILRGC